MVANGLQSHVLYDTLVFLLNMCQCITVSLPQWSKLNVPKLRGWEHPLQYSGIQSTADKN